MEIWKDVVGYEGMYKVSDLGRVKSLPRKSVLKEKILKQINRPDGYFQVGLHEKGIKKNRLVHQLVTESFLNHIPCGHELVVNHINFIKTDNRLENLEIVTNRENANRKHCKSSSEYTGVVWDKARNKWKSQIIINGKTKYLGRFTNETDASNAYQKALLEISS